MCAVTCELTRPVFVADGARRLPRRVGYLLAATLVVYLAMLGFVVVSAPALRLPEQAGRPARVGAPHVLRAAPPRLRAAAPQARPRAMRLVRAPLPAPTPAPTPPPKSAPTPPPTPAPTPAPTAHRPPATAKRTRKPAAATQPPLPYGRVSTSRL